MAIASTIAIAGLFFGLRRFDADRDLSEQVEALRAELTRANSDSSALISRVQQLESARSKEMSLDHPERAVERAPVVDSSTQGTTVITDQAVQAAIDAALDARERSRKESDFRHRAIDCARQYKVKDEAAFLRVCSRIASDLDSTKKQYWNHDLPPSKESSQHELWTAARDALIDAAKTELASLVASQTKDEATMLLYCLIEYREWYQD